MPTTLPLLNRVMGRAWMFRWRHQLNHRRGPYWTRN